MTALMSLLRLADRILVPRPGRAGWSVLPLGPAGGTVGMAALTDRPVAEGDLPASAGECDRLLDQITVRNRMLETIREMLEALAGPVPVAEAIVVALESLRRGLRADEVALLTQPPADNVRWRAFTGPMGRDPATASSSLRGMAEQMLADLHSNGSATHNGAGGQAAMARQLRNGRGLRVLGVTFLAPGGPSVLLASWQERRTTKDETALMVDAAHSLLLALKREEAGLAHQEAAAVRRSREREEAGLAHQEAAALRRARELQRGFLSRMSHELRTPLTAIRGYASSLMQPDVTWDRDSQQRFLDRIAAESARLGRLVDDLLDFSAIESGIMRLQRDWCDIPLVLEAAIACLPPTDAAAVSMDSQPGLPAVWADHDRMEQVFVNLLNNAVQHNPPGTKVRVTAVATAASLVPSHPAQEPAPPEGAPPAELVISVIDDGNGMPGELAASAFPVAPQRLAPSAGAGLGLSIAKAIVEAHGGSIELRRLDRGTCFRIRLLVEVSGGAGRSRDD